MLNNFRKLYALLTRREKRSFIVLVLVILIEALLEMAAIGLIPLYITTLAYPDYLTTNKILADLFSHNVYFDVADRESVVVWASLALLLFFVLKMVYAIFTAYWKARFAQNRALKLSVRLFNAYLAAPYVFHLEHNASELFRNVNDECANLAGRVLSPMVEIVSQSTMLAGIVLVVAFIVEPVALIWLGVFLVLGTVTAMGLQRRSKRLGQEAQTQRGAVVRAINEALRGVKEISLMQRTQEFSERLSRALGRVLEIQRIHRIYLRTIPSVIENIGIVGLLGATVMLVLSDATPQLLVSTLSVFAVALARLKSTLRGIMVAYSEVRHNSSSLAVVHDELLALEQVKAPKTGAEQRVVPAHYRESIRLDAVSFTYPNAAVAALDRVNLSIEHGQAVGFVGATGSGKSTVLDIIMGIVEPCSGTVLVDGEDIRENLAGWQSRIGYVPQDVFLVDASIQANIALGLAPRDVDPARVAKAVAAAELGELVAKLPEGLNTVVGERGVRLSGGERQRIAIARALYAEPDVLVMDEATSALDNTTEAAVVRAVDSLKGDRTVLMIAHRLSTVRRCDSLVFIKNGRVDAVGTYEQLRERHGEFRSMTEA